MFGNLRGRMFEQGSLKLVMLHLLHERPRHGYEIIKAIQDLAGGEYSPSPGVIYPTLAMLEELGHASAVPTQAGKKPYAITAHGAALLDSQRDLLRRVLSRLAVAGSMAEVRHAPELQRAMQNIKTALRLRLARGGMDPAAVRKVAEAIDRAAIDIERT